MHEDKRPLLGESEFLIIGAGPAGLQMAYFLRRAGRDAVVLERGDAPGAFWQRFPRSRDLISFNKPHSIYDDDAEIRLRWDWNSLLSDDYEHSFFDYSDRIFPSADEMLRYLHDFAERYALDVRLRTPVERVSRDDDGRFRVRTPDGDHLAHRVIVATGLGRPHVPAVPGIELAEDYETCSFDPDDYVGQRVLIIGKGNSAFELADRILYSAAIVHLASESSVTFAWKSRHAGHLRAHYARILDAYQLKTLHSALDCHVRSIEREDDGSLRVTVEYIHADQETETFRYDRVVRATGFAFDDSIFDESCRPIADGALPRFPAMTSAWESKNVPGMYFAGTMMQVHDFRGAASTFIHGFRYNVRTLSRLLLNEGRAEPTGRLPLDPAAIGSAVLERVSRSSGLWAQFGFLGDVLVVEPDGVAHYEELPRGYVEESGLAEHEHYYVVTIEWGKWEGDVFSVERHPRAGEAHTNVFLHPIIRHYSRGELIAVHHVLEDLLGNFYAAGESGFVIERGGRDMETYHAEEHEEPLRRFFAHHLEAVAVPR